MKIDIFDQQSAIMLEEKSIKQIVDCIILQLNISCDQLAIHLVDKKTICDLHKKYFNNPTETDCISFPINDIGEKPYCFLGEIFLCPLVGIEYAKQENMDPLEEITLYIIHGLLHLLGYDDQEEQDQIAMRKKEKWCMSQLKEKKVSLQQKNAPISL